MESRFKVLELRWWQDIAKVMATWFWDWGVEMEWAQTQAQWPEQVLGHNYIRGQISPVRASGTTCLAVNLLEIKQQI